MNTGSRSARPRGEGRGRRPSARRRGPAEAHEPEVAVLYGWHPVAEALRNERRSLRRLLATENSARRLAEEVRPLRIAPSVVRPDEISRLLEPDALHQGLYLEADPLPSPGLDDLGPEALVLVLDQITDPHNVGAIVRTAAAFAVEALVTTARHSPAATGVLAKAASGGLEHVPFVVVRNLAEALVELGERGFWRIGLDSDGTVPLGQASVRRPLAIALGAEGKGLRQRTRSCCDVLARLDLPGAIRSLNVSNATAIALHALAGRREPS